MQSEPPKIDIRKFSDLVKTLRDMAPHYTPEWPASDEKDPGVALLKIFSHITETVINRLNQAPHKNFVAFLDMLGIKLLPAQTARVPLTFKLASGTEKDIFIPARTQAAADKTKEHDELPFETEKNLLATISNLKEIISVDPTKDAIFKPPPGFVNGDLQSQNQVFYKLVSSASAGAKNFQLDQVKGLKEGDFLKIGGDGNRGKKIDTQKNTLCNCGGTVSDNESNLDYVVISNISGTIVSITDDLLCTHPASTPVEKVTKFNLFEGKNFQEHSLYLGHKDLFNIESTGKIILQIALAPGAEVGNSSLNLKWEYWGENKEKEKDEWIALQIEDDKTDGFRQGGKISLLKTMEGKIKEEKLDEIFKKSSKVEIKDETIKEIKTRWIRCRLENPLAIGSSIKLPTADTIFITTSPSEPIPPDAGYFNDVPLELPSVVTQAKVIECLDEPIPGPSIRATAADTSTTNWMRVDSVEGFKKDDEVVVLRTGKIEKEANIAEIDFNLNKMKLSYKNNFECQKDDIIWLSKKTDRVLPFGVQPRLYDAFYIGSQEAFSKKGAKIMLTLSLTHLDTSGDLVIDPKLSWEYWNGKGWQALTIAKDQTDRFLQDGDGMVIEFYCPEDIEETEASGQKNYWVRARIVGGDYGREEFSLTSNNVQKVNVERKYNLPIIRNLGISYSFDTMEVLHYCLTYNNLDFQDKTLEAKTQQKFLQPFVPLEDTSLNLYLGFDRALSNGPIRIYFAAKELPYTEETKPKMDWNYRDKTGWSLLDFLDETEGLIVQGHLELIGPSDFVSQKMFGQSLYWVQGSLVKGTYASLPELQGIYPNTTWAIQAETIKNEILGSSDGEPDQTFSFLKFPVLEDQEIRARETLSEEEKETLIGSLREEAIFEVRDEKGNVAETWVLWTEVPDFFDSKADSRHYALDRATGQLQFGDGINGMIPQAGDDNIKAFSYQAGGGAKGNVKSGEIKTLKSAVAGVDKVSNPVAADGGADTATLDDMLEIGPAMISHRNRAVTVEDFEWLAKLASRKVVKVRCLPNTNNKKQTEVGWVTVIIVPDSLEAKPFPSLELRRKVRRHLEAHSANTLSSSKRIYVNGPLYVEVGVSADVVVTSIDVASEVEREVRRKLNDFFHPLTGGPEREGWDFGRDVSASDVYKLLEDTEGVDHVENLKFRYNGTTGEDVVEIKQDYLVASGIHAINLKLK